jgi:hypothetical protein
LKTEKSQDLSIYMRWSRQAERDNKTKARKQGSTALSTSCQTICFMNNPGVIVDHFLVQKLMVPAETFPNLKVI